MQVSIDASLDPEKNWKVGRAIAELRCAVLLNFAVLTQYNSSQKGRNFDPIGWFSGAQSE